MTSEIKNTESQSNSFSANEIGNTNAFETRNDLCYKMQNVSTYRDYVVANNSIFIQNDINNGILLGKNVMPHKEITSDGNSSFEMGRKFYTKTNTTYVPTPFENKKKWIGGNRDSSSVTNRIKNNTIGSVTMPSTYRLLSFKSNKDLNVVNDALRRCRSGGSCAPAKKGANKNMSFVNVQTNPFPLSRTTIPMNNPSTNIPMNNPFTITNFI